VTHDPDVLAGQGWPQRRAVVAVSVPGDEQYVPLLRTVLSELADRHGFAPTQAAAAAAAVDEACALLLPVLVPNGELAVEVELEPAALLLRVSGPTQGRLAGAESLGWTVLAATTAFADGAVDDEGTATVTVRVGAGAD